MIRRLVDEDAPELEALLARHVESSMFLRSNIRSTGLHHVDAPRHGEYWGSVDSSGAIRAVLAHYWNGNLMMQADAPAQIAPLLAAFRDQSTRRVAGVLGRDDLAARILVQLSFPKENFAVNRAEGLFALELADLIIPTTGGVVVSWREIDHDLLRDWIRRYDIEALGADDTLALNESTAREVSDTSLERWVLIVGGVPVSLSGFNARLPDIVQIGPAWTPPEYRNRGYARALVARMLASANGVRKAVLFTNTPAAIRAYRAIGFRPIGLYRLALLRKPVHLRAP